MPGPSTQRTQLTEALGARDERVIAPVGSGGKTTIMYRLAREFGTLGRRVGDVIAVVGGVPVEAGIDGVLRGLIRPGIRVLKGMKISDIDPRGRREYCFTISDKSRAIAGGVHEAILMLLNAANAISCNLISAKTGNVRL